jgi:hypothetical protein
MLMMNEKGNEMLISRKFLENLEFRVMDKIDQMGFAGCGSPVPLIAEFGNLLIIIDGAYCEVIDETGDQVEFCDNILALGY